MRKGFYMEPKMVQLGTNKGFSNDYPMGTAEEPFQVVDSVAFSLECVH